MIRFNQRRDEPLVCQCNGSPLGCNRWYARDRALVYEAQIPCSRMEPHKRAVYQLKSSKIQERSEVDWERVTDRGKETWEWLGLFRWFIPRWPHDMHLGRPSICSDAAIASVLHRELNLTRQESQEAIVEPPGSDSHAVVVWGGWTEMFTQYPVSVHWYQENRSLA